MALAALATFSLIAAAGVARSQLPAGDVPIAPVQVTKPSESSPPKAAPALLGSYSKLPLSFVPNAGQVDRSVRYYAQGNGFSVYFARRSIVLSFIDGKRRLALGLVPVGASVHASPQAGEPGRGRVNYLVGHERRANLPTYHEITYRELWPGIDMVFRGQGGKLKYEFRLAPGADPSQIRLTYRGADRLSLGSRRDLLISTPLGTLRDSRPRSYQRAGGKRIPVKTRYVIDERGSAYGFALGSFSEQHPLVIDPGLAYSTFLGGSGGERGIDIAVDGSGGAYITGGTASADFPTSVGAVDQSYHASNDAFVTKLDSSGTILYSTYLGGSGSESGLGIAVDGNGNAYVSGGSGSADFPTTPGAFDTSHNGYEDVWAAKLNTTGSTLLYSTFIGGSSGAGEFGQGIAVDGDGSAYVTGGSGGEGFPTTGGSFDTSFNGGGLDAFIAKLDATGSSLVYSTFLGGPAEDVGTGIALGVGKAAFITGKTRSPGYPTTTGAFDQSYNGGLDAFVTKLGPGGAALGYSTFLGKAADEYPKRIAVDGGGRAYLAGWTNSKLFPTTAGAFDTGYNGGHDVFVSKLNVGGSSLVYSSFIGGSAEDEAFAVRIDAGANTYVAGSTKSSGYPTTAGAADTTHNGDLDAFVTKLAPNGGALAYSTFLGGTELDFARGIGVDSTSNAYVTGKTQSSGFPTTAGAAQTSYGGVTDGFVTKIPTG